MHTTKIGLFGIGLDAYWPQFVGLKERLEGHLAVVESKLVRDGIEIVNLGLIDTPEKAFDAGHAFRTADVDLIFLHVTTYALSSTVLPVVQRAKVPVIILNLSPLPAIDYAAFNAMGDRTKMTGEWLASCSACPVPEIANVFNRARIEFHQITGQLHDDPECWDEVDAWMDAARVAGVMFHNRLNPHFPALRSDPMALSGPPAESKILAVMEKNLDKYERIFFTMLSSGAQVWIRGHRLYDGPQSQAMLKKWMAWYKKYYDVIHGDIIHLKRPDGRGLDYTLHVSPNGKHKGMLLVFNPLDQEVTKTLNVPLYYTGATGTAKIREAEGPSKPYQLDGASNMKLPVTLPANGYSWFIIE